MIRRCAWTLLGLAAAGACAETTPAKPSAAAPPKAAPASAADTQAHESSEPVAQAEPETPAEPEPEPAQEPEEPQKPPSVSRGQPNDGTLAHAAVLPRETPALRFNPNRESVARYATDEVIAAIERAARTVHEELPGGRLTVNDLSLEQGGPIDHHGSHRNGRDADILFYLLDDDGEPIESVGAPLDPEGYGHDYKDLSIAEDDVRVHLDAPRTWRFVQALVSDPVAQVQRIFVVEHIRSMLLAEAERQNAPEEVVQRVAAVTCQPGFPHDDHLHVRWYCDPADIAEGCEDIHPVYPWHRAWLAERDTEIVMAGPRRKRRPTSKVYSHKEARKKAKKKAGRLHPKVRAFLERRKAWLPAPHPGRRWCR